MAGMFLSNVLWVEALPQISDVCIGLANALVIDQLQGHEVQHCHGHFDRVLGVETSMCKSEISSSLLPSNTTRVRVRVTLGRPRRLWVILSHRTVH